MLRIIFASLILLVVATASARAQAPGGPPVPTPAQLEQPGTVKRVRAVRVPNGRITVDGRFDEAEWRQAEPAADFVQQQPSEGAPATEQSEVRFLYDDDYLYVGGTYVEPEIDRLVINELRRDFSARDGDLIVLILDTFYDKLNAYNFQTNPGCALRDSQSYDDGRNINANWDAVWFCRASIGADAFHIEQAIPFKQLRFPERDEQVWGLNIFRLIRHSNEQTIWNAVPRQFNQFKTSYEGVLEGIRDVRPGRNIRVKPFVTGQGTSRNRITDTTGDGGVDVKIGLGTGLVLDGTYRTDFSQVEADAQQVNLTRFNLFFPERREFFLENQGAFQIGGFAQSSNNLVPFFSRTIGLSDTGTPIPIVGGLRLSGRAGRNTVGLLNMQTEEEERPNLDALPAANFTVLRYARDFLTNSSGGVFFMNKERGDVSNRLVGGEVRFNLMGTMNVDGLVMASEKTGFDRDSAFRTGFLYDPGLTQYNVSFTSLGADFKDDLGFIPREGVDILTASVLRRMRPRATSRYVREFRATLPYNRFTRSGLGVETATVAPQLTAELNNSSTISATAIYNDELLTTPFRPQGMPAGQSIPVGRYHFNSGELAYTSSNSQRIAPTFAYRFGEFYNGNRTGVSAGVRVRFNRKLAVTASTTRDALDVSVPSFTTTLATLRVETSFSTRMFLTGYFQYNSVARQVLSNIRYNFVHRPLSDIFVVYNETRSTGGNTTAPSRALILKFTQLLSF